MGKGDKRSRVDLVRKPERFSAWFHIANPGEINLGWPELHLFEVNTTGTQTDLTDEQVDNLVRDVREALSAWNINRLMPYLDGGRVLEYYHPDMESVMLLALVPVGNVMNNMDAAAAVRIN